MEEKGNKRKKYEKMDIAGGFPSSDPTVWISVWGCLALFVCRQTPQSAGSKGLEEMSIRSKTPLVLFCFFSNLPKKSVDDPCTSISCYWSLEPGLP